MMLACFYDKLKLNRFLQSSLFVLNSNQFSNESLKEATEYSLLKNKINKNLLFLLMFYG